MGRDDNGGIKEVSDYILKTSGRCFSLFMVVTLEKGRM